MQLNHSDCHHEAMRCQEYLDFDQARFIIDAFTKTSLTINKYWTNCYQLVGKQRTKSYLPLLHVPNQKQWEKYGFKIYYLFGLCTFRLSFKHAHRLNPDANSFVETIRETLWIICVIYVLCLSCVRVCSLLPCSHLLGKG